MSSIWLSLVVVAQVETLAVVVVLAGCSLARFL
jgi:hypothetical protein